MKFSELDIHPDIIRAAQDMGFEELTSIQEQCLGPGLEGRDITGISQTGTGKTVAFLMPILNGIFQNNLEGPAALVVTPTRELCLQITEEARALAKHHPIGITAVYGGEGYREQEAELAKNPHLIVATPGRLIDYVKQHKVKTSELRYLVLDEADRMFDMGFIRDIRYIMKFTPSEKQTMLFSATLAYYVLRLASDYLHDPVEVKVESESIAVDKIEQKLFHLGRQEKLPYLINQIFEAGDIRAIIFTNYRSTVSYLVNSLRRFGIAAVGLSSLLDQRKRVRLLKDFKLGHYTVLVATDVASRGLHVDDVTHVFNYDLPQDAEGYIHRIGRTARAGKSGIAVSYCCEEDYENLPRIQRLMGIKIPQGTIDMKNLNMPEGEFEPFHDRVHAHRDTAATEREHGPEGAREARPPRDNAEGGERQDGVRRRRRRRRGGGGGERGPEGAREARPPREDAPNGNTRDVGSVRDLDRAELMGRLRDREEGRPPKHEHPHSQKAHHEGAGRRRHRGGRGEGEGAPRQGREEHAQGRGNGDRPERGNERGNDRGGERGGRHRGGGGRGDRNDQQHRGGGHGRGGRGQGRGGEGRGERGGRRRRGGNNEQRREHRRPGGQPQKKGFFARIISLFKKSED